MDTVDARFELETGKDAATGNRQGGFLDPAQFGFTQVEKLGPPAMHFGVTLIHPHQVTSKQRRLIAARPRPNFENGILLVGGILRQQKDAQRFFHLGNLIAKFLLFRFRQLFHLGIGFRIRQKLLQAVQLLSQRF